MNIPMLLTNTPKKILCTLLLLAVLKVALKWTRTNWSPLSLNKHVSATIAHKEHHTRTHTAWDDFRASKLKSYIDTQKAAGAANHKAAFAAAMNKIATQYRATPDFGARAKKVIRPGMTAKGYAAEISRLVNKYRDQQGGAKVAPPQIYGEGKEFKNRRARALAQYRAGVAPVDMEESVDLEESFDMEMQPY